MLKVFLKLVLVMNLVATSLVMANEQLMDKAGCIACQRYARCLSDRSSNFVAIVNGISHCGAARP